jgi:ABC-type multidrug transport system fused ATPase/permease subunit
MYILKIFYSFILQYKFTVILYLIITLLTFPLESIVIPQIYSNFFEVLNPKTPKNIFIKYFLIILVFLIIVNGSIVLTEHMEAYMIPEFNGYIIIYIFKNLLYKYENNIQDIELGKLITRLSVVPHSIKEFMTDICTWILPRLLTIIIINIYFFYLDWKIGLASIILLILFVLLCYRNFKKCVNIAHEKHKLFEMTNQITQDKLSNSFSIYSNGKIYEEIDNFTKKTNIYSKKFKDNLLCMNYANILTTSLIVIIFISLNVLTTICYLQKKITYNNLVTVFIIIIYYMPCLWLINSTMPSLIQYTGTLQAVDHFIKDIYETDLLKNNDENNIFIEKKINYGKIDIKNLNFGYNNNLLFENFNLTINDKEKIALIGSSGNGKSSIIKLIMGYYKVPNNTIYIDDQDINEYDLNDLRKQISYVNQNNKLFDLTLLENIQYGNNMSKEEIIKLCEKIKVDNIFKNLEKGFDTKCGIEGNKLSGGQRQIVHLLRCLAKNNKIVILDEPTSAIDKVNVENIINVIKELSKKSTLIIITHDNKLLDLVDRVITIDSGKIISDKKKNYIF